jgi:hypothetical protein
MVNHFGDVFNSIHYLFLGIIELRKSKFSKIY